MDGPALAARTSPPSDVLDEDARTALEQRDEHNVVRLILPREDAGAGSRYRHAATVLAAWRADGALRTDPEPALYVYELDQGSTVVRGLVGALALSPAADGVVLPHEATMAGPVADRLELTREVGANLEPIYCVYSGGGEASRVLGETMRGTPLATATVDGATHRLWAVRSPADLASIAADLLGHRAVIADGHHRYATYLQHQADRHAAGAGEGPWDRALTFLVDVTCGGSRVDAIHRVVPGLSVAKAAALAADAFRVQQLTGSFADAQRALADAGPATALLLTDGAEHHLLTSPDPAALAVAVDPLRAQAWRLLDVTVAHALLVRTCWGLPDDDGSLLFRHDAAVAVAEARRTHGTALLLNPVPAADVLAVAEAGEQMPRKSTLFTPKPLVGMLLRCFDTEDATGS